MKIISLGTYCYLKSMLLLTKYNKSSDIFDWIHTYNFEKMLDAIENNFDILEDKDLMIIDHIVNKKDVYDRYEIINRKYEFRMPHEHEYFLNKLECINKFKRRYDRFINYKTDSDNYLYIRVLDQEYMKHVGLNFIDSIKTYNKNNYDRLIKYLPEKSKIILLINYNLDQNNLDLIYDKFLVVNNVLPIHEAFYGPNSIEKNKIINKYETFLQECEKNFNELDSKIILEEISKKILKNNILN